MKIGRGLGVDWRQAAGEAVLIVLGVSLALLAQAWWEYRSDRESEDQYLASLHNEFEETADSLLLLIARREAATANVARLLEILGDPTMPAQADSIRERVRGLGWTYGYRPSRATLEDLVGSGNLRVLRDPELRLAIARYKEVMEGNASAAERTIHFFEQVIQPFLLSTDNTELENGPREREANTLPHSRFTVDYTDLSGSLAFENMLASYIWFQRDAILWNESLLREARKVLALLP